jgi:predicted N-acyltransferase
VSISALKARWLEGISDIPASLWNSIAGDYPFLRHEFLQALESTGCAAPATGWTPRHLTVYSGTELVAAVPLYEKSHSWGEFVFDFAWAKAWEERGLRYYPKLVVAVPFTPASGPRLLISPAYESTSLRLQVLELLQEYAERRELPSVHALFVDEAFAAAADKAGWLARNDCHFQWQQRGYRNFEEFLATFSAEKRKKTRRERRRVLEQGIHFETLTGAQLTPAQLVAVYEFQAATFARHGHLPYLSLACFRALANGMADRMLVKLAIRDQRPVAAAVYFRSDTTLYGRYWGAGGDYHSLHFEACYYQGIDLCIELGLQRFEPGTQGEHKLARGFEPVITRSAHWIADAPLRAAVASYLKREQRAVANYAAAAAEHLPFRDDSQP